MIEVRVFAGEQPAIAERLLESPHATQAVDCVIDNGNLRALESPQAIAVQPVLSSSPKTLFLYDGNWFSFNDVVTLARSPIRQDQYQRVYIAGLDVPRYTRNDIAASAGAMPGGTIKLGVPKPSQPLVSYTPPATNDEPLDDETRFYVCTYVTSTGEESAPSPVSEKVVIQAPGTDIVTLTVSALGQNDYDITKINLYRTFTGGDDAEFFRIGQIDYNQTTYTDDPATVVQGPALATIGFDLPPEDMHSLVAHKGGMLIGATDQTICPSEAYLPYAYKKSNQLVANAPVVAMAALPNGVVVATQAYPELLTGYAPDTLELDRYELEQSCVSARSMVDMGLQVIYASPDGLVSASVQGAALITNDMWLPEQWRALRPETIHAYQHEGEYIAFYDDGVEQRGFVFDPARKDVRFLSFYATAGYRDLKNDALYLLIGGQLCRYRSGGKLTYIWRTKVFETPLMSFAQYRVKHLPGADLTQTTVRVITEDGVILEDVLTTNDWDYVPPGLYERWQIEIESNQEITAILMGDTLAELGV